MDEKPISEKTIEKYLRDRVKALGGIAYKFVSPGNVGVPDRLVVLPGGKIAFVELKAPGRAPRPSQVLQLGRLQALGAEVAVIDSKEGVDAWVQAHA